MHSIRRRTVLVYSILFVFLVAFFSLTVSSGDDLYGIRNAVRVDAAGESLFRRFAASYSSTNGRILGNSLHLIFSFSFVLNAVFRALIVLSIVWAIARIARLRSLVLLPILTLLTLMPSIPILRQAMVWSAGFYNYVPPVLLVLVLVILVRDVSSSWKAFVIGPTAFLACLWMETVTVGLVVFSGCALIVSLVQRRARVTFSSMFVGAAAGAAFMFSSPAYRKILEGEDSYRPLPGTGAAAGGFADRAAANVVKLSEYLASDLAPLLLLLAVMIGCAAFKAGKCRVLTGVMGGLIVALLLLRELHVPSGGGVFLLVFSLSSLLLFLGFAVSACVLLCHLDQVEGRLAAAAVAVGTLLTGPLLVVTPFGPRNFFVTAVCFIVAIGILSRPLVEKLDVQPGVSVSMCIAAAIAAATLLGLLGVNKLVEVKNRATAVEAYISGKSDVSLSTYPLKSLVHDGTNPRKLLLSLQALECDDSGCHDMREMNITFR